MASLSRFLSGTLSLLLLAAPAKAQFEIKGGASNVLDPRRAGASATVSSDGAVESITVRGGGSGYTAPPAVVVAPPPSGITATATAEIAGGQVTKITFTEGSGYSSANPPAVYIAPPKVPTGDPVSTPQFAGAAATSATAGALPTEVIPTPFTDVYPRASDNTVPTAPVVTVILARASFGHSFASGVPLYFMGDEIQRPLVRWDGATAPAGQNYWRSKPVQPGETFASAYTDNLDGKPDPTKAIIAQAKVSVQESSTASSSVKVATVPPTLTAGAMLLGQRVNFISGTTVTLAGNADETIASSAGIEKNFSPYQPSYYSPHADRVFASQPGRVTITWVSAAPDTSLSGESKATFKFRRETFAVSSASRRPAKVIYWTEKGFDGPLVPVPAGRIVRVNPVFNSFVPGMATEYVPVGSNTNPTPGVTPAAEPRTLWFDNLNGPAALHAYNVEGRLLIEYLGSERQGASGVHNFLGADIVDIKRVAEVATIETKLGERIRPRQETAQDGDDQLIPSILLNTAQSTLYYGSFIRPDSVSDYYAERENLDPDRIIMYWLDPSDAAIHFLPAPSAPGLSINWPKYKRKYTQIWPAALADYQPVNVPNAGSSAATGPKFAATNLPLLAFQDDPTQKEASIDARTQRLIVDLRASADKTNRSLLKFNSSTGPWYVRLYIQSEDRLGSPAVPDPDGNGPLNGAPAVYTINDMNADGIADWSANGLAQGSEADPLGGVTKAVVGGRLEPPSGAYELGGYIAKGRCYSAAAYKDPFADGVDAAAAGGIIPVNALSTDNELTVWWFRKVQAPGTQFESFHVPAIAARYKVAWPAEPQDLVMASGKGVENPGLTSEQQAGSIYVQNNPNNIGYNPNEEHAVMVSGNAYALRDDLNTATSSQRYVLIQYTEPGTARPAMRVVHVVRKNATYPLIYDKLAGTPAQPPMPLTLLPPPLRENGSARNTEVTQSTTDYPLVPDPPPSGIESTTYDGFTFVDRKGTHWIYRGPHTAGTSPSFGMKYYYYLQAGFYFPALAPADQPVVGSIQPYIANTGDGEAVTLTYHPKWPDDPSLTTPAQLGVLHSGETLMLAKAGLPQVMGQSSAQVVYQQSIAQNLKSSVALHDPIRAKRSLLETYSLEKLPGSVLTTDYAGKTYFQGLPPNLQNRFYFDRTQGTKGGLMLIGEFVNEVVGEDYLHLNQLSTQDIADLKGVCPSADPKSSSWNSAIDGLKTTLETFRESSTVPGTYVKVPEYDRTIGAKGLSEITDPDTAVVSYAVSTTGAGSGYVTLVFGNGEAFTDAGDPVAVQIIKVSPQLYPGDLKVLLSSNPLDEQVVLRHSGDYAGVPENFEFHWLYAFPDGGGQAPVLPASTETIAPGWINPDPGNTKGLGSSILVGASPDAVINTPAVLMGDVHFTMQYRLKPTTAAPNPPWSNWTRPGLVEGWIKRVLAKITPFNQRMTDLYSNSVNTDVSLVTQAGTRWEGDIALNLNNINDSGLIEIYETVLNRGKSFTISSDIDTPSTNNALILAAGYLNDLYTILGNEAFADAANPTISVDDQDSVTEVNTSRFSFESQVANSLDEELALLRGRDDFATPGTTLAPAYNRLWWNYTRGIDSGEALYAVNYNIHEKAGSPTADGIVDAADAQRMFPQGHGDAYGHYLTALTGYYKLLTHPYFTWTPSAEAVNVLGVPVLVDYKDERKFAAAAANVARTAQQMLALEYRRSYKDDPNAGWEQFRDGKNNVRTGVKRWQGLDETASRSTQGAFFHWVTGNALLPDKDRNPDHSGVQLVDRITVPELNELPSLGAGFQGTMDSANSRINPLGLSPGAITFDLDPYWNNSLGQELADPSVVGKSHYEQVSTRALAALNNAVGSFNQAATMTRLLRNQENQITETQNAVADEEYAMLNQLYDIYGMAYAGDVGPGKTYPQGYEDPDFFRWFIIDRPLDWVDTTKPVTVTYRVPKLVQTFTGGAIDNIVKSYESTDTVERTFKVTPNQWAQFADVVGPGTALGKRPYTGSLQDALVEVQLAQIALLSAKDDLLVLQKKFYREKEVFGGLVTMHTGQQATTATLGTLLVINSTAAAVLESIGETLEVGSESANSIAEAGAAFLPLSVGFSNDVTSAGRGALKMVGAGTEAAMKGSMLIANSAARILEASVGGTLELIKENTLMSLGFTQDQLQAAAEFEQTYRELVGMYSRFSELTYAYATATQKIQNLLVAGDTIRLRRETLRQRAASVINGYRTKDLTFRTFRNEALVEYRTLFDLASRYTYLAAKSFDYETGLLGTPQGQAVINRMVASRSLGDLTGGVPRATTSSLGDAGLAGTLAQLNADFAAAEGRLGINNPDHYNTVFSLRQELFRLLPPDEAGPTSADDAWRQTLEQHIVPNLLSDPQVAAYCRGITKPDGSPVPGFIIPFSTTIQSGKNFFGLSLAAGDHAYSPGSFATKIAAVGLVFPGYVGMVNGESVQPNALSATPYAYLIPCGMDSIRVPLGDTGAVRSWQVNDQAMPLPYNLGASDFNSTQFFTAAGTLSEQPWVIRKHQPLRAVSDPGLFDGDFPIIYSSARLIGRSAWNSQWKIVIPAVTLLQDEQAGLNSFVSSVNDIQLFLRTYSNAGN
ncbi:MAG: hypothetical protein JWM59_2288 [Verrucomicrobiales bacterium]|nr:hypothetical protein [Verrucomicrobiales bacterium]